MHDHRLKFKVSNQVLIMKEQDSEHIRASESSEKLKFWIRL